MIHRCFLIAGLMLLAPSSAIADVNAKLFAAARNGNLAAVKTALESGAEVDAKTDYGVTALYFAAEKGHVEVVRLLLERGANPNAKDTFYGMNPLIGAASKNHREIMQILIRAGAEGAGDILKTAVGDGDVEGVKTLLDTGKLRPADLSEALTIAISFKKDDIAALLKSAGAEPEPEKPVAQVSEDLLKSYAGTYKKGLEITFAPDGAVLKGSVPGQPTLTYRPTAEHTFEAVEFPGIKVIFKPVDGKVTEVVIEQGGGSYTLERVPDKNADAKSAEKAPGATDESADAVAELEKPSPLTAPRNWPSFRGPHASGVSDGQGIVARWDGPSSKNIAWKTPIPGLAHSAPIIWGDRVFITTAVSKDERPYFRHGLYGDYDMVEKEPEHSWRVFALDRKTGKVVWEKTAHEGVPKNQRHTKASHANCTPATDGKRVVASFGSEGLYCYDFDGNLLWKQDLGILNSGWFLDPGYSWGFGSSPILYNDSVIVQCDVQDNPFLAAFDLRDGKRLWRTSRDEIPSWGTPTIHEGPDRTELITNGTRHIRGYDPATGQELWRLSPNSEVTIPTPVVAHGLIFITGGYRPVQPIYAIKTGAVGDISLKDDAENNEQIAWSKKRGGPYHPTPIVYGDHLYTCSDQGILTCYVAKTGEQLYKTRINEGKAGGFTASPVAADGKLFFTSEDGDIYVVKAGPEYRLLARNVMGEVCMSPPAISNGLFVVRAQHHVFGIGASKPRP